MKENNFSRAKQKQLVNKNLLPQQNVPNQYMENVYAAYDVDDDAAAGF